MLDISKIRAVTLDLDDTLWPIWPTIERAEKALSSWLFVHAPVTAAVFSDAQKRLKLREQVVRARPDLGHDMSVVRRECIRLALERAGEDTALAGPACAVFLEHRMQVDLFADALSALQFLASRYPVVAISNGNADVARVGLGEHFSASLSAHLFGVGKPDARIFHAAADAVGVRPDEVLHVGDDAELDVLGALGAGMQTVWLNRAQQAWGHPAQPHATVTGLDALCQLLGRQA